MDNLYFLNSKTLFNINEINGLMPLIHRITKDYNIRMQKLINAIEATPDSDANLRNDLECECNDLIKQWNVKMEKLGGKPKGLWFADFDNGEGYWCWKYPQEKIEYWHEYKDGFSGRITIEEYLNGRSKLEKI